MSWFNPLSWPGDIIGGAIDLFGQDQANQANKEMQEDAQLFNSREAMRQRQWANQQGLIARNFEERMSNTAYQRQVKDMQKAGLNPIMAAMKGGGASTPSASAPSGSTASSPSPPKMEALKLGDAVSKTLSRAMDVKRLHKDLEEKDSVISLNKTAEDLKHKEAELVINNAKVADQTAQKIASDKIKSNWDATKAKFEAEISAQQARKALNEADLSDESYDVDMDKIRFRRKHKDVYYWSDVAGQAFGAGAKGATILK